MDFFEGLGTTGLMTALSMEGSSSSDNEAITAGVSPGYDAIVDIFNPLLIATGIAGSLFEDYSPSIFDPVEEYLNGLVTDGMIEIVNQIMPLDSESEEMIRNATKGDVDPEVEQAAENMSEELNFTSKESLSISLLDLYLDDMNSTDEDEINSTDDTIFSDIPKKFALLIGQGHNNNPSEDTNITQAVKNDFGRLATILVRRGYQLIAKSNSGDLRFNFNVQKNYVDTKLFPWLRENLTKFNNSEVFIGIMAHGTNASGGRFSFSTFDGTNGERYYWSNFSKKLDDITLDRNADGNYSANELANPMYNTMTILIETCDSGNAIDALSSRDTAKRRIIITSSEANKDSYVDFITQDHSVFLAHFLNFLEGDIYYEFLFTWKQNIHPWAFFLTFLPVVIAGGIIGALSAAAVGTGLFWGAVFGIVIWIAMIQHIAYAQMLLCYYYGGKYTSLYNAWRWTKDIVNWGSGFWLIGSTPQLYNDDLVKETTLW